MSVTESSINYHAFALFVHPIRCATQTRPSAPLALLGSSYLKMNKPHSPYSIAPTTYVKYEGACISKLFNETWGLQSNKVARWGEAHLGCKFHDRRGQSQIHPMSPPANESGNPKVINSNWHFMNLGGCGNSVKHSESHIIPSHSKFSNEA
ncbi:predicted protein [Lichtheimia corymbifera JMRC:FSU:9682]|uniref:Uncharacterized protein n=1 Tax=Lichtheimia corymbifera JMRC:FSU:9682 TaxID=1263082 RepID=A0A068RVT9_9FUNG|nr:predicted protein [Lichtheimia corymbifera JMRC:FSU:9682]